jgi:hypothetical protein
MTSTEELNLLLDLPSRTLVLIAAGYLGYRLAYVGRDFRHRPIDILFKVAVFAFVAKLTTLLCEALSPPTGVGLMHEFLISVVSVGCAIGAAALWRGWLELRWFHLMRTLSITFADGTLGAWESISTRTKTVREVIVRKKDGTSLWCCNPSAFASRPFGPCLLGEDGSVALYATHFRRGEGEWTEIEDHSRLTYIPAGEISEIEGDFVEIPKA